MIQSFVIIGNGPPALALIRKIVTTRGARASALLTSEVNGPAAVLLRQHGGVVGPEEVVRDTDGLRELQLLHCDWLLCANTTTIVSGTVLDQFSNRVLNFHPGLLPHYAGLHPHQWAIRNGELEFGVTIHFVDSGIDTGDIVAAAHFPIRPHDTGLSLFRTCIKTGAELFARVLEQIIAKEPLPRQRQELQARRLYRHAEALDGRIDWTLPAGGVVDFVRAGNYYPLASPTYTASITKFGLPPLHVLRASELSWCGGKPGELIRIEQTGPVIGCGRGGAVVLERVLREKQTLAAQDWHDLFARLSEPRCLLGCQEFSASLQ
jgi:UDP-4-amino-4-deoxy-L-arabinose formyltransferase/UDP-glucuronic acid dehydrogenase (UDP-4-keto-hexauronic acid decarboxylating)